MQILKPGDVVDVTRRESGEHTAQHVRVEEINAQGVAYRDGSRVVFVPWPSVVSIAKHDDEAE